MIDYHAAGRAATLLYQKAGNLVLAVQSVLPPSATDWEGYVNLYREAWRAFDEVRILVVSEGGAPDNRQQRAVNELVAGLKVKVAVVSMTRSVAQRVRRLQVVNDDMRLFQPEEIETALDFLDVALGERASVKDAIAAMRPKLAC